MSDVAIAVEGLGKSYVLGHRADREGREDALRDVIARSVRELLRKTRDMASGGAIVQGDSLEEFWALRDVSFEIKAGERVGIIGRNGAGKSTLLKTLSRITEPTRGRIQIRGRVASLLEVGTGFHPELTGRENVFLNGAILGMTRDEIRRKFDEIVQFAEVEKFLDTPVKRYSSGMYVRLAFAVAAHLEPEILIVDEVLAVGDAQFQKKCLGKMQEVGHNGRTILFVSHNIAAITNLCDRVIYLSNGVIRSDSVTNVAVGAYLRDSSTQSASDLGNRTDREGSGAARFIAIELTDKEGRSTSTVACGQDVVIRLRLAAKVADLVLRNVTIAVGIDNSAGQRVWHLSNDTVGERFSNFCVGRESVEISLPRLPLVPGTYSIVAFMSSDSAIVDWVQNAADFTVEQGDFFGTGRVTQSGQGVFMSDYSVSTRIERA